jgi:hypothetical protein
MQIGKGEQMRQIKSRRPSASMAVALLALFVALGGTVYASAKLNGSQIKKGTLPANRIKKHSITGAQVNLAKLGTVPGAENANSLGGQPASAYTGALKVKRSGLVKASKGQTVTILTSGPFTLSLTCEDKGGGVVRDVMVASSTEANSLLDSSTPGTTREFEAREGTTPKSTTGTARSFIAPSGASLEGISNDGINSLGSDCFAEFDGLSSP